jgi:iron uptake system component EfeO
VGAGIPVTFRAGSLRTGAILLLMLGASVIAGCGYNVVVAPPRSTGVVRISVTPSGCEPKPAHVRSGHIDFVVANVGAPTASEIEIRTSDLSKVLGERENLVEGLSASFILSLPAGNYVVSCPGAIEQRWPLVATSG